jgi:hypothetical protein
MLQASIIKDNIVSLQLNNERRWEGRYLTSAYTFFFEAVTVTCALAGTSATLLNQIEAVHISNIL